MIPIQLLLALLLALMAFAADSGRPAPDDNNAGKAPDIRYQPAPRGGPRFARLRSHPSHPDYWKEQMRWKEQMYWEQEKLGTRKEKDEPSSKEDPESQD